ncbi:hypothetical protein HYQ45_008443 [Verticillium longisporum]|uniref:SH3 domain-containing protein n=1 Tax=Verticillium longisporum TaxID=100787 RepID=A0A8I2ZKG0_VERLO|nr:hypothetical protein HYQ45_008443 [Verticillium longisporum]
MCPAFQSASVSTTGFVADIFPFLPFVSSRETFDQQMGSYIRTTYVQQKFAQDFGCGNIDLRNTDELYPRFTTSVICNAIVQNSIQACNLAGDDAPPLCADTCAFYAQSEALITSDRNLCPNPSNDLISLIRADFTNCYIPPGSLSTANCVQGVANEPNNCGYGNSTIGLCSYCASGGINSTDTCCYNSDVDNRCADVVLPSLVPSMTFTPPTSSPTSSTSSTSAPSEDGNDNGSGGGLSGGAIAGIVIGSIVGLILIAGLIFLCTVCLRRRRRRNDSHNGSVFNQPSPSRQGPLAEKTGAPAAAPGFDVLPGGRIARMSALEGTSDSSPSGGRHAGLAAAAGAGAGAGGMSSPQGMASQQSEQLPFFKDYYSSDDIHPGDRVAVLWAYQPRANDEFSLERGDMLKVVGIWDDGWATGVMMDERADEWDARRQAQRDSGVSSTSARGRDTSPPVSGEIKAFPLVCVCLPEHWRKTIEGDGSTETGSSGHPIP